MRRDKVIERINASTLPAVQSMRQFRCRTAALASKVAAVSRTVVAQRAATDRRSGPPERPTAVAGQVIKPAAHGRAFREVADTVAVIVISFDTQVAAGQTNPQRGMCIGTGQGSAFRGSCAPARYPRLRTDRGTIRCTAPSACIKRRIRPSRVMPPSMTRAVDPSDAGAPTLGLAFKSVVDRRRP